VIFFEIIIGLVLLVALVAMHELGHAIAASKNGVVVKEFGVGMPPRAYKKKLKNGVLLSLNWLPLGGFVKLQGEYDEADKKGDYGAATFWQKTKILLAGIVTNWLVAAILLSILAVTGMPKVIPNQASMVGDTTIINQPIEIAYLTKNFAADKAGMKVGDKIIQFDGQSVSTVSAMVELSKQKIGQEVAVVFERGGIQQSTKLVLGQESTGGIIGAGLVQTDLIKSTWSAPFVGFATAAQFTWVTIQGLGDLVGSIFTSGLQSAGDSLTGPIGIVGTIFPLAVRGGLTQVIFLTAIISLSLGVMNVLPIPALDGGRWSTMTIFRLLKKKLTKEREEKIQAIGFYSLMALMLVISINDVIKLL